VQNLNPELIITSPLTRALLTASGAFGHRSNIPVLVHHLITERVENACDHGTPRSDLVSTWKAKYPHFDFTPLHSDGCGEVFWHFPEHLLVTKDNFKEEFKRHHWSEPFDNVQKRIDRFTQWLQDQPAKELVVVGHSSYFQVWLKAEQKLKNCEVCTITVNFD